MGIGLSTVPFQGIDSGNLPPRVTPTAPQPFNTQYANPNLFGTTNYFNTNQQPLFPGANAGVGGWWNLSSGGGKGVSRISWMTMHFGMKWTEFRKKLVDIFLDNRRDAGIMQRIFTRIAVHVPVRTGRLLDTIFNTFRILRMAWGNAHHWHNGTFEWTIQRPNPITGHVAHKYPPETGYGELYTPVNPSLIPQRTFIRPSRTGLSGLYGLNDPGAVGNPIDAIRQITLEELRQDTIDVINTTILYYYIPSTSFPLVPDVQ